MAAQTNFIDIATIWLHAGKGGDGAVSFHREKFVAAGGPDGGDGGRGGDIIFVADDHLSTLMDFRYKRKYVAPEGGKGGASLCHGKNAENLVIKVPLGTVIKDAESGLVIADLSDHTPVTIAKGGRGGYGNAHFATPTRQIPKFAKPGMPGEDIQVTLELKLIADVGLIGFPNVGKSTLINTWLGEERLVAFDMPGTTRDAITVPFERNGQRFELVDTAGLRRKGKVFEAIEKFSVVKTLQAIESAHVVLLLLDATQGVTDQDAHIAGYILESGRAVVLAVNKWDAVDDYQRQLLERSIETRLAFLKFASLHFISAKKRQGLGPLWTSIAQAHRAATCKMSTPVLTRLLLEAVQFQSPKRAGMFRPKMRYAHQGGMNPPVIVIHGNSLEHVTDAYKRFLEGRFRKEFDLVGTPLRIEMKTSHNPFVDKDEA